MYWIIGALVVGFAGGWICREKFGTTADKVASDVSQKNS